MNDLRYSLISGATGGLGKRFAIALAKEGKNLILTARSNAKLDALSNEIKDLYGVQVQIFPCDLASEIERESFFQFIQKNDFNIDALFNIAGVDTQMSLLNYSNKKLIFQTRVLFESVVDLTHFVLMRNSSDIKILTISSICGITPMPYFAIYSALKGGLISFFDAIRFEFKNNKNVVITTIIPSSIPTRDDIKEDIKKQGLQGRLSQKSPEYIVKKSLNALKRRKRNYIPGFYNRMVFFTSKLLPKSLKLKIITKKFKNKQKDAFLL